MPHIWRRGATPSGVDDLDVEDRIISTAPSPRQQRRVQSRLTTKKKQQPGTCYELMVGGFSDVSRTRSRRSGVLRTLATTHRVVTDAQPTRGLPASSAATLTSPCKRSKQTATDGSTVDKATSAGPLISTRGWRQYQAAKKRGFAASIRRRELLAAKRHKVSAGAGPKKREGKGATTAGCSTQTALVIEDDSDEEEQEDEDENENEEGDEEGKDGPGRGGTGHADGREADGVGRMEEGSNPRDVSRVGVTRSQCACPACALWPGGGGWVGGSLKTSPFRPSNPTHFTLVCLWCVHWRKALSWGGGGDASAC